LTLFSTGRNKSFEIKDLEYFKKFW